MNYNNIDTNIIDLSYEQRPERTILVSVDTGTFDSEVSIKELSELAYTAGAEVVGSMIQKRNSPNNATFIGKGKLEELLTIVENDDIDLIIFDSELSGSQLRNIEKAIDCRVIDRTMLILDIFAGRAQSSEGRLQVELAQLEYNLPRLTGKGVELSRLGASGAIGGPGIGTRGPGETKLETDRRHIRRRITSLRSQINEIEKHRTLIQKRRTKEGVITVALVGYTNAGKSTLMNYLTDAGVLTEDKLFATLDPTSRALKLPNGQDVLLIDTVGFIRLLPHYLVDAFRSTLEEAADADVILNICDISSPDAKEHLEVSSNLLIELGCKDTPIINVLNKSDIAPEIPFPELGEVYRISAKNGEGVDQLLNAVVEALPHKRKKVKVLIPFTKGALSEQCRQEGSVESEEFTEDGVLMIVTVDARLFALVKSYIVKS